MSHDWNTEDYHIEDVTDIGQLQPGSVIQWTENTCGFGEVQWTTCVMRNIYGARLALQCISYKASHSRFGAPPGRLFEKEYSQMHNIRIGYFLCEKCGYRVFEKAKSSKRVELQACLVQNLDYGLVNYENSQDISGPTTFNCDEYIAYRVTHS
jgi:DNA-directed RNA polymerase subunit RPC12/RpoP